jgi:hypothetical protein
MQQCTLLSLQTVQIIKMLLTTFPQLLILYVECLVSFLELFPIITMLRIIRVFLFNVWGYEGQKFLKLWSLFF